MLAIVIRLVVSSVDLTFKVASFVLAVAGVPSLLGPDLT